MKRWQFWVGVLISVVFLYLALRKQHLGEVWIALSGAQYLWLIPGIAVYMIAVWVRAWRWHFMLRPLKKIPTYKMFPVVAIGYMGNNIYPARAGEVLRAYVLKRHEGVPVSASLATVIVERIFDGVVMLSFIFLNFSGLARVQGDSGVFGGVSIQTVAVVGTAVFLGALVVFLLAAMFPFTTEKVVRRLADRLIPARFRTKVLDVSLRFLGGLESLRSPVDILMIFVTSVVIWLLETAKYWLVTYAFGIHVSFFVLMLVNGVSNLATTLPSAPGYVGTFDAPAIAILSASGVAPEAATAYTLVLHAALWLPITLLGMYYFAREGLQWGEVPSDLPQEAA
ncbi:MAG TPA: lysylphosphatidylglycerol synthase transmembrane domain-containing protein [Anaerolineaceae bacterium]|nr:lysylphosphatidylglycerol synthase transmembrane domain-containing protein [Anaerolineaceae bacterium]